MEDIEPWFPHPVTNAKVVVFLDACHMFKLTRNTWATLGSLRNPQGEEIKWHFIESLHELQDSIRLRLGNKLKRQHIDWKHVMMKVNIAAQTLSSSVADAIEYCDQVLKLPQFQGSRATVDFIRIIDELFDRLNSRNILGKYTKAPLSAMNFFQWRTFFEVAIHYILGLTDSKGKPMLQTKRSTPFKGFIMDMKATIHLFNTKVETSHLKYLLMYKMSQDHLELFFFMVRSGLGCNNNPSAREFCSRYKRLMVHLQVKAGAKGNCIPQGSTAILECPSGSSKICAIDTIGSMSTDIDSRTVEVDCEELIVPDIF